jgi:hypothetical protein
MFASLKKHKKLYYVPGLISLCVIPIIFFYFIERRFAEKPRLHMMEVYWYEYDFWKSSKSVHWLVPSRQYLEITLTGNIDSDEVRLQFGELRVREIYANKDTINGVNFHFGDKSKYEEFVRVLDMCNSCCKYFTVSDSGIKIYDFAERKRKYKEPDVPILSM